MLYVLISPGHTLTVPPAVAMVDGFAGNGADVTESVCATPAPHTFDANTVMVPPAEPAITVIVLLDEVPLHPAGKVQL